MPVLRAIRTPKHRHCPNVCPAGAGAPLLCVRAIEGSSEEAKSEDHGLMDYGARGARTVEAGKGSVENLVGYGV